MKIRNGFVSNSSASSFVIAKVYLNPDQLKAVRAFWSDKLGGGTDPSDKLYEDEHYISYDLYHICDDFFDMCMANGINEDLVFIEEVDGVDHQ